MEREHAERADAIVGACLGDRIEAVPRGYRVEMRDRRHLRRQHQGGDKNRNGTRCSSCGPANCHWRNKTNELTKERQSTPSFLIGSSPCSILRANYG